MDQNLPKSYKITLGWRDEKAETLDVVRHYWIENKFEMLEIVTASDETILVNVKDLSSVRFDSNWNTLATAAKQELARRQSQKHVNGDTKNA